MLGTKNVNRDLISPKLKIPEVNEWIARKF